MLLNSLRGILITSPSDPLFFGKEAAIPCIEIILPYLETIISQQLNHRLPKKRFLRLVEVLLSDITYIEVVNATAHKALFSNMPFKTLMQSDLGFMLNIAVQAAARLKIAMSSDDILPNSEEYAKRVDDDLKELFQGYSGSRMAKTSPAIITTILHALPRELSPRKRALVASWLHESPYMALRMLYSEEQRCAAELGRPTPEDARITTAWAAAFIADQPFDLRAWARDLQARLQASSVVDVLVTLARKLAVQSLGSGDFVPEDWRATYEADDRDAATDEVLGHIERLKRYLGEDTAG